MSQVLRAREICGVRPRTSESPAGTKVHLLDKDHDEIPEGWRNYVGKKPPLLVVEASLTKESLKSKQLMMSFLSSNMNHLQNAQEF